MAEVDSQILQRIPQRPPFLYIENLIGKNERSVVTQMHFSEQLDFFQGHFPNNPIVPGVILCEMAFQTGALLISFLDSIGGDVTKKTAVVTRIQSAKFKNIVAAGSTVQCEVKLLELIDQVAFMQAKSSIVNGETMKTCLQIQFSCALIQT